MTGDWGLGVLPKLSRPLERGRAKGAGWMCRVAAPFYEAEACHLFQTFYRLFHTSRFSFCRILPLRGSLSPALRAPPSSRGGRVLRLFQNSAALLIFMRRTTISHFSFLIQRAACPKNQLTHDFPRTSSITRLSSFISIGFATWAFMPSARAFALSSAKALAVMAMMGIFESCGSSRRRMMVVAL